MCEPVLLQDFTRSFPESFAMSSRGLNSRSGRAINLENRGLVSYGPVESHSNHSELSKEESFAAVKGSAISNKLPVDLQFGNDIAC
jgi:hypothetical protein